MAQVKKHHSISIIDQGNLLTSAVRGTAFLKLIVCLAASTAIALLSSRTARADYEVPNSAYDPPANYYNTATSTQTTLRTQLHGIITSGFTASSYGASRTILPILWQDPNNSNNMILTYLNQSIAKPNPNGTQPVGLPGWDAGTSWNREHTWPQSLLGVNVDNSYTGPASDLFELTPTTQSVNSSRSNKPYGILASSGSFSSQASYFYPGDAQKGDSARIIFYMATRYYNGTGTASINNLSIVNGLSPSTFQMGDLQALLKWNYTDGVDNFERRKNDLIYDSFQHNRNPYIDHPEYVWAVFGDSLNNSQISVATPASDGSSAATVNLNNIIVGGTFGTSNVTISKTGGTPTTYDITAAGNAITTGSGQLAGTGHPFDYSSQNKSMTVGLNASANSTAGAKTGTITIDNTDLTSAGTGQGKGDGNDVVTVNANVLDHANGSFATPSDTNSKSLNVGIYKTGSGTQSAGFNIYNLEATAGFTAGLQYSSQSGSGNTAQLSTDIASAFTGTVAAGGNVALNANLTTASAGSFAAAYTLTLSDDVSLSGHTTQNVTLNLSGKVRNNGTVYWNAAGDSAWDLSHTKTNWVDPTNPDVYLEGDTVVFNDTQNPSGSRSVTLNTSVAPAGVSVDHSTGSDYTISGSGSIGGSGGLTKSGSGQFTLSTNNTFSGGTTVTGGTLVANHYKALGAGGLTINNSATTRISDGLGTVVLPSVNLNGGSATPSATFDIGANSVVIPYSGASPFSTIQSQVLHASNGLAYDQTGGITSSSAGGSVLAVGYAEANELFIDGGGTYVNNQSPRQSPANTVISDQAVILKLTFVGDVNLDGTVDTTDANTQSAFFGTPIGGGADWALGDLDGNGSVDVSDVNLLLTLFGSSGLAGGDAPAAVPVPEPSTLVLAAIGLAGIAAFARRRRNTV